MAGYRVILCSEPGILRNKHSYKHPYIANCQTNYMQAGEKHAITIKPRKASTKNDTGGAAKSFPKRRKGKRELPDLQVGDVVEGTVRSLQRYGAFLDVGGVCALLHVSQISQEMVLKVADVLTLGTKLKVMVMSCDKEKARLNVSTRKLEPFAGAMFRDPQQVYDNAQRMAEEFKKKMMAKEVSAISKLKTLSPALDEI